MVSNTLRNMLTSPGGFSETRQGEIRFPEIYPHPHPREDLPATTSSTGRSSGKVMAEFQVEPEITLDLMMAASYLYTLGGESGCAAT